MMTEQQVNALRASLKVFGLVEIPVINSDNTIIAGHQRVALLLADNPEMEIEVRVPSRPLTPEEFARYNLSSNRIGGQWDWDKLANQFDEEMLSLSGFSDRELQGFEEDINNPGKGDGSGAGGSKGKYSKDSIKEIVLSFSAGDYDAISERIQRASKDLGVDDVTALFLTLLTRYEESE